MSSFNYQDLERAKKELSSRHKEETNKLLDNAKKLSISKLLPYTIRYKNDLHKEYRPYIQLTDLVEKVTKIEENDTDKDREVKLEVLRLLLDNKEYFNNVSENSICCLVPRIKGYSMFIKDEYKKILQETKEFRYKGLFGFKRVTYNTDFKYSYFPILYNENHLDEYSKRVKSEKQNLEILVSVYTYLK